MTAIEIAACQKWRRLKSLLHNKQSPPVRAEKIKSDQEFLDGTSPRIYPWNQSKISNLKSSSPRIYPWGRL